MKRPIFVLLFFAAAPLFAQQPLEIRYHSVPDFLRLPPDIYLGEATGVAVNSKGHIFVFSRATPRGPRTPQPPRNSSSLLLTESFSAKLATISTPGPLPTP